MTAITRYTFAALAAAVCLACAAGPSDAQTAGERFEDRDGEPVDRFTYDPQTGRSVPNTRSWAAASDGNSSEAVAVPFVAADDGSFTLEMFVRPTGDPQRDAPVAVKAGGEGAWSVELGPQYLPRWKQTYYGAAVIAPGGERRSFTTGNYVTTSRIHEGTLGWRHVALVYDARAKTLTTFTDVWQRQTVELDRPLRLAEGPWRIGGREGGAGFDGLIDEVKVTARALQPHEFLRARADAIRDVSFASEPTVLPADIGYFDVKRDFGAAGDGRTDDTAAFAKAMLDLSSKVPLGFYTLYVPPGEYLISDTIRSSRFFVLQGAGRDRTVLRLKDRAEGYADPKNPKPFVRMTSTGGPVGSNRQVNGSSIDISCYDLTIDTGRGNPGACGLEYHANNIGSVKRVTIRSGDGSGYIGLDLRGRTVGPSLIKHVRIIGFDYAAWQRYQEYSMTFEHVTLEGQHKAGLYQEGNIMAIRGLTSRNSVPAVVSKGANSMVALIDADLAGGAGGAAVEADGALYVRDLATDGYAHAIHQRTAKLQNKKVTGWTDRMVDGPAVDEYVSDGAFSPRGEVTGSIRLPVEETPDPGLGDLAGWVNVRSFEHLVRGEGPDADWTDAVQAAIDSGAKTVYFPRGDYPVRGTIHLRGSVERLFGMMKTGLARPDGYESKYATPQITGPQPMESLQGRRPIMIYDHPDPAHVVVIERMSVPDFLHTSKATLAVITGRVQPYHGADGAGRLFLEDVAGPNWRFGRGQKVWARQWNPEQHGPGPGEVAVGADVWVLGFKTEYESSKFHLHDGSRVEIFGSFIYPIGQIPADRPIFRVVDSDLAVQYGTSVYRSNHQTHIVDTQGEQTAKVGNDDLRWVGSRARMDLYRSRP